MIYKAPKSQTESGRIRGSAPSAFNQPLLVGILLVCKLAKLVTVIVFKPTFCNCHSSRTVRAYTGCQSQDRLLEAYCPAYLLPRSTHVLYTGISFILLSL